MRGMGFASREWMGGACMFGGGSTPAGSTTTQTTSGPWSAQQPYLLTGLQDAANQFNSQPNGYNYYPGQQVADLNKNQTDIAGQQVQLGMSGGSSALQQAATGAGQIASGAGVNANPGTSLLQGTANGSQLNANPANSMLQNTANGSMLSAGNPYFQQMAQSTLAQTMPGIQSSFAGGGRLDSGLASQAASYGANQAVGNLAYQNYNQGLTNQLTAQQAIGSNYNTAAGLQTTAAQDIGQNYTNDVGNQLKGGLVASSTDAQQQADLTNGASAAALNYQQQQAQINAQMAQYGYNQQQPAAALSRYIGDIQGNYGTSGSQSTPYFQNSTANALSGVTGGLGILNGINNLGSASNGSQGLLNTLFG